MKRRLLFLMVLASSVVVSACGPDAWAEVAREPERTEVVFVGTVHRQHLHDEDYPMELLSRLLRAIEPEVVVAEIPPAGQSRIEAALRNEGSDPWLESFPELEHVVYPLSEELGFDIVAGSGWERAITEASRAYWSEHPTGPADPLYQRAARHYAERVDDEGNDPEWLHSPTYRRLAAWHQSALSAHAGEELGIADPIARARRHARLVVQAVFANRGRRIAIVFDAERRWMLEREIRSLEGVVVHDTRYFLEEIESD